MSLATKRRIVMREIERNLFVPKEGDKIAKVLGPRGNNLHMVEDSDGNSYLVSMPSKFRKSIWIKRNNFLIVEPIAEGDKVKGEIVHVLDNENILYLYEQKIWPCRFLKNATELTRAAKRNLPHDVTVQQKHEVIDEDMLPPSESESEESDENEQVYEANSSEEADESDSEFPVYNPNRTDLRSL